MRHSVRARFLQTLTCAGCAVVLPASAMAAGGGSPVHIDPASPVAKEYALPLATARGAQPESGHNGKPFGSGIGHASSTTAQTTPVQTTPVQTTPVQTTPVQTTRVQTTPVQTTPPQAVPATPVETAPTTPAQAPTAAPQSARSSTATAPATTSAHIPPRRHRHHSRYVITVTLTQTTPARPVTGRAAPAAYRVLRPGSGSGLLWMALAAVVVVALGSAGGLALRRRR